MPNDSRGHRPSLPAPSRTDTQTTAVDPSFSSRPAANSSSLDGGMELSRITSSRLGTAEAMLAGHDEEELERIGASESQREKSRACAKEEEGNASSADEWTYPDGGLKAWTTVLGCFMFGCCQLGYGLTWGVLLQDLVKQHPNQSVATLNLSIGLMNFCMYFAAFFGGRLADRFGYKRMIAIGSLGTFISLVISAVASHSLPCLFLFNGLTLGVSHGLAMPCYLSFSAQWFRRRRGIATGIVASGAGIGGGTASLIMRGLLPEVGYRNTVLIYAGMNAAICMAGWFLMTPRLQPLKEGQRRFPKNWLPKGIWGSPTWWSWLSSIAIGIFGYLTPYFYLTAYTTLKCPQLDPNSIQPAIPLVISNYTSGMGRILAGFLADRLGPVNTLFLSFFLGGLFQLVYWPFAENYGSIIGFAALKGLTGSWFMSLIPVAAAQLFGLEGLATIVGFSVLVNSPGQMLGATLSGFVLSGSGGSYTAVACYSGGMMCGGSLLILYARRANQRKLFAKF